MVIEVSRINLSCCFREFVAVTSRKESLKAVWDWRLSEEGLMGTVLDLSAWVGRAFFLLSQKALSLE